MADVFLDASAIIYTLEGAPELRSRVAQSISMTPDSMVFVSRLSMLECRVKPMRENRGDLLARYDGFFSRGDVRIIEIDAHVVDEATRLRAAQGFKTADAIQLSSAIVSKADTFLTGDRQLARCDGLRVEVVP